MNKCWTKFGKKLHIALCMVVKYIHEKGYLFIYKYIGSTIKLKDIYFKCIA